MKASLECLPCFVRQSLDAIAMATDDEQLRLQFLREVLGWLSEWELELSPPIMGQLVHRRVREITGQADPYRKSKQAHTQLALALLPALRERVAASDNRLETALRLAVAGNAIDLGVKSSISLAEVQVALEEALQAPLGGDLAAFQRATSEAATLLYLADNAGELVFDRLLIEELAALGGQITVAVRGAPVINDATLLEARESGIFEVAKVVDNGSDAPGTLLEETSPAFQRAFAEADLIIAKGQGNFESLSEVEAPLFFLLKAKCPVIAGHLGQSVGSYVLAPSPWWARASVAQAL